VAAPEVYVPTGVGACSAEVVAIAAAVIETAARSSGDWDDAGGAVAQAVALRRRGLRLAAENARAYAAARAALGARPARVDERQRQIADIHLGDALAVAADIPLSIAEAGVDAAELGALAAENGADDVRADAAGASALAAGAAIAAAHLVEVNLATQAGDERIERASAHASHARSASERALGANA
jgi:formiminotetrahydrofolate cyclodeaminase